MAKRSGDIRRSLSNFTLIGGGLLLLWWAGFIFVLAVTPLGSVMPRVAGRAIEHLGQFGDAFAPITALFALIAAVGAWRSYETQKEQLEHERDQASSVKFDDAFFRLLQYYETERARLEVRVPGGIIHGGLKVGTEAISAFREYVGFVVAAQLAAEQPPIAQGISQTKVMTELLGLAEYRPLMHFPSKIVAIVTWLEEFRANFSLGSRGALLIASLTDDEIWLWSLSLNAKAPRLLDFARDLGILAKPEEDDRFPARAPFTVDELRADAGRG